MGGLSGQPLNDRERELLIEIGELSELILERIQEGKPVKVLINGFRMGCQEFVTAEDWLPHLDA